VKAPRYFSQDDLEALKINTRDVVASIEQLVRARKAGSAWSAPKASIKPGDGRYVMSTLAIADEPPFMAVKALHLNQRNAERGLATLNSVVILLAGETGQPVALLDGNWITAVRTAGLSALAAQRMARPQSSVAAFIGCGVQGHGHLRALAETFPLKEVRAFGRGAPNRDSLCRTAKELGCTAIASATAREALEGADLVVTSVPLAPKPKPFLDARWLKPGAFVAMVDLALPWHAQGMSAFGRIVIDDKEQEAAMPEPMVDASLVTGDLMDLVEGRIAGRASDDERSAFAFRGVGLADLALAALAARRAGLN
jgi:ornithine cyclodeaminase/alanine dehydrogenase-like protein (mu-crystallin family)